LFGQSENVTHLQFFKKARSVCAFFCIFKAKELFLEKIPQNQRVILILGLFPKKIGQIYALKVQKIFQKTGLFQHFC
jgi:hypothetical protein